MKILILLAIFGLKSAASASIRCFFSGPVSSYTCNLIIDNPDGFDNFTEIEGDHLPSMSDSNVLFVTASSGNTKNFPSIICEKFRNARLIRLQNLQVEYLGENSFSNCQNLNIIDFFNNRISSIHFNAFARNSAVEMLILSQNELKLDDPRIFANLPQLLTLSLENNPLEDLPAEIFRAQTRLTNLFMYNSKLNLLRPEWFETLYSLTTLQLYDNNISDLPEGTFKNLVNLQTLQINRNKIRILRSLSFPCRMQNLLTVNVQENLIDAVDPEFFNRAPNVRTVNFNDNQCISGSFSNFHLDRNFYLEEFQSCNEEFGRILSDKNACRFFNHPEFGYTCEFSDEIYSQGAFDITRIHSFCLTDTDVMGVVFKSSKISKIPREVFTTFPRLVYLQASGIELEEVPKAECGGNLRFIDVSHNSLRTLDSNAFSGCGNVEEIILDDNCVARVQPCEETFVEKLGNLKILSMVDCACVSEKFHVDRVQIGEIEKKLKRCFKMWYAL